ncbi:uncharacterized protein LOC131153743 [Malania oleifera]|uniref:uncharacterized protein LOC131153743 n=1 Tax=Malania oleifera TaxID=397392 RepID=UPI0025ADBBA6|nr:uncharacterized protein LOC131153743 [Malania oleifera]
MFRSCNGCEGSELLLAIAIFASASVLVALCAKHARRVSRNQETSTSNSSAGAPKSPLRSPMHLLTAIGNKSLPFMHKIKGVEETEEGMAAALQEEGFGEGGLWQKAILMGEKCRPPVFSGVIYYDCCGSRISEMPRSPRASLLAKYSEGDVSV